MLLFPGLAAVAVFLIWELAEGGFAPIRWYPGALFFLALLAVVAVAYPAALRSLPRAIVAAVALFAGFAAWSFLSIAWAELPGEAWNGANRTLLYLDDFALFAVLPWRVGPAAVRRHALGGWPPSPRRRSWTDCGSRTGLSSSTAG